MEISQAVQQSTNSLKQAIGISNLRKAMSQDAQTMNQLLQGMEAANSKVMENSVTPHKGQNIDIRL